MTGVTENKLKAYHLTDDQWDLAEDLQAVLVVAFLFFIFSYQSNFVFSFSKISQSSFQRPMFLLLLKLFLCFFCSVAE
jgi:hypothetical protein